MDIVCGILGLLVAFFGAACIGLIAEWLERRRRFHDYSCAAEACEPDEVAACWRDEPMEGGGA